MPGRVTNFDDVGVGVGEVREALEALLADPDLPLSSRNKRFLRYVVEERLAGRAHLVKAYAIATEVFDRPADFDPVADPIVRIEATRVRAALDQYYATRKGRLSVRFGLPKGNYVPTFEAVPREPPAAPGPEHREGGSRRKGRPARASPFRAATLATAVLAASMAALMLAFVRPTDSALPSEISEKPLLVVERLVSADASREPAEFRGRLVASLGRFERWMVQDGERGASSTTKVPRNSYSLSLDWNGAELAWQLTDRGDSTFVGADVVDLRAESGMQAAVADLADRLGGSRGLVNAAEDERQSLSPTLGHGCIARLEVEIWIWDRRTRLPAVRDCLERTLAARPDDPQILAALARVLMRTTPFEGDQAAVDGAYALARRSLALAPRSSQAELALAIAHYRRHDHAAAAEAALRARDLNPADRTIAAYAGVALLAAGRVDEGAAVVRAAETPASPLLPDGHMFLALDAYRLKDYREAIRRTEQLNGVVCFCAIALKAAAFAELGDMGQARKELKALLDFRPDVASTFTEGMLARGVVAELSEPIRTGLLKAGLAVE